MDGCPHLMEPDVLKVTSILLNSSSRCNCVGRFFDYADYLSQLGSGRSLLTYTIKFETLISIIGTFIGIYIGKNE